MTGAERGEAIMLGGVGEADGLRLQLGSSRASGLTGLLTVYINAHKTKLKLTPRPH